MQSSNGFLPVLPAAMSYLGAESTRKNKRHGEDVHNDPTHPLQSLSTDTSTFASALKDGTLTRPGLRRKLHIASTDDFASTAPVHPKNSRGTYSDAAPTFDEWAANGSDTGSDSGNPRNTKEVYVHEVCSFLIEGPPDQLSRSSRSCPRILSQASHLDMESRYRFPHVFVD